MMYTLYREWSRLGVEIRTGASRDLALALCFVFNSWYLHPHLLLFLRDLCMARPGIFFFFFNKNKAINHLKIKPYSPPPSAASYSSEKKAISPHQSTQSPPTQRE
jgi:hypothetical protein